MPTTLREKWPGALVALAQQAELAAGQLVAAADIEAVRSVADTAGAAASAVPVPFAESADRLAPVAVADMAAADTEAAVAVAAAAAAGAAAHNSAAAAARMAAAWEL